MNPETPTWLSPQELKESGLLQEVNRQFFHPLGLALAVGHDDETGEWTLAGIHDGRDDPEGYMFDELDDQAVERGHAIVAEQMQRMVIRRERLGYGVQPLADLGNEPPIQEVRRLTLRPDDVVVVKLDDSLPIDREQFERLTASMEAFFEGHKVLVMVHGADLEIVSST